MRQIFLFYKGNSGEIARKRLKLLLVSDQTGLTPGLIDLMKDEMVGVLSRYAEVDTGGIRLNVVRLESAGTNERYPALSACIPIRQWIYKRNEECF